MAENKIVASSEIAASLIVAAKSGSDYAFGRIVRLYQSPVRAFLRRMCGGDAARADDLAQLAFLRAYQKINSFNDDGKFLSWLYRIAYRIFLDEERKLARRQTIDDKIGEDDRTNDRALEIDLRLDLEAAMAVLKPAERAVITLCLSEGLSHEEASAVLEMPLGTVKSHIARGREKLKKRLEIWQEKRSVTC